MTRRRLRGLVAAAGLALLAGLAPAGLAAPASGFAVIELFQSQGCSSCPPANANVNAIAATRTDVLALSFAVDYWDQLGWKDTFATHANTRRQQAYSRGLHKDGVATPQVVINGRKDVVGADAKQLAAVIAATPAPLVQASFADGQVRIAAADRKPAGEPAEVWLVRYDPRVLNVPVQAGENSGKTLPHRNIVKELTRLGRWTGEAASYPLPAPKQAGLKTAVLVQQSGGPILAAARD